MYLKFISRFLLRIFLWYLIFFLHRTTLTFLNLFNIRHKLTVVFLSRFYHVKWILVKFLIFQVWLNFWEFGILVKYETCSWNYLRKNEKVNTIRILSSYHFRLHLPHHLVYFAVEKIKLIIHTKICKKKLRNFELYNPFRSFANGAHCFFPRLLFYFNSHLLFGHWWCLLAHPQVCGYGGEQCR